jgi:type II secretory pathway component PulF
MSTGTTRVARDGNGFTSLLKKLHSIQVGKPVKGDSTKVPPAALAELMRLLLMLIENGLSLPKALSSLAADRNVRKYQNLLLKIRASIEAGGTLSDALGQFPKTFSTMQVQQIRIGEKSGSLEIAMRRVCEQLERNVALRKRIIKKVSYPALILVAGTGLMIFMVTFVVPEFETVYQGSGVDLPIVTRVVTGASRHVIRYGWIFLPVIVLFVVLFGVVRSRPRLAYLMDASLLRLPIVGPWVRDVAVLQFAETTLSMVQCGYKPVEAVQMAAGCVRNRRIRAAVEQVKASVRRGERLSTELGRHEEFFPNTLCQLVSVGEQSGDFAKAMNGTCNHLRERLESRVDASVGLLEPVLTIGLAAMIGGIVLSIYMPIFHMFEVLE